MVRALHKTAGKGLATMKTSAPHIVSTFEDALKRLKSAIVQMAGAAETQIDQALACLAQRNPTPVVLQSAFSSMYGFCTFWL